MFRLELNATSAVNIYHPEEMLYNTSAFSAKDLLFWPWQNAEIAFRLVQVLKFISIIMGDQRVLRLPL